MQTGPGGSLLERTVQGCDYQEVGILGAHLRGWLLTYSSLKNEEMHVCLRVPTVLQALTSGGCDYPHFTGEETGPERLSHLSMVTQ